jgi:hypothetical protein
MNIEACDILSQNTEFDTVVDRELTAESLKELPERAENHKVEILLLMRHVVILV